MKQNNDLISIVIPIYNVEKYLKRCVDSVINQTYKNLEIILVDDGSTDNCGKICDEYAKKDKRIKVIHKKNGGLSDARNAGIDVSKGRYLSFIDSDDFVDKRFIGTLYNNLINNDADLSLVKYYSFSKNEDVYETMEDEKITVLSRDEYFNLIYEEPVNSVVAWNKLYKKEIFNEIRYPVGKINEDEAVIHYIIGNISKIVISNLELYYYFQRNDSIMKKDKKNNIDRTNFIYDRINYFKENKEEKTDYFYKTIDTFRANVEQIYNEDIQIIEKKKYLIMFRKLIKEYKTQSIKQTLKYYLLAYFPNLYFKLLKIHKNNLKRKQYNEEQKSGKKMERAFKKYCAKQREENKPLYLIFNTPYHGNLGDQAIAYAEIKILKDLNKEPFYIMSTDINYFIGNLLQYINTKDIVFLHGGGYFGTLWENETLRINKLIQTFYENRLVTFPQTIYYEKDVNGLYALNRDKKIYEATRNLTIICRDKKSYEFCKENFEKVKCFYTPDVVTYLDEFSKENNKNNREEIGLCFRKDKEKVTSDDTKKVIIDILNKKYPNEKIEYFDTCINKEKCDFNCGVRELKKLLKKISHKKLVITDRLHGMIFCAITNTPCIALGNLSGKVKGAYDWIKKYNDYIIYVQNEKDIEKAIDSIDTTKKYKYNNVEYKKILKGTISKL